MIARLRRWWRRRFQRRPVAGQVWRVDHLGLVVIKCSWHYLDKVDYWRFPHYGPDYDPHLTSDWRDFRLVADPAHLQLADVSSAETGVA